MPWQEVVVNEILEQDNTRFFETIVKQTLAQGVQLLPTVAWIDGVVIAIGHYPDTEDIVKEKLRGVLHYGTVWFSRMEYKPTMSVNVGNTSVNVQIIRENNNPLLSEIAKFVKDFRRPAPAS